MKYLFRTLVVLGGLAALAAMGLMFYDILKRGIFAPNTFELRLVAIGAVAYIVGQLGFFASGGKLKT